MKNWIKILLVFIAVAVLSVAAYFILRACGITSVEGLRALIAKCGAWGWIVYIILFITCTILLCFVPGTSATFIAVAIVLFGAWQAFAISAISVFLSSSIMFLIGNSLGERIAGKIVGKEALQKAQDLIDTKSKIFLPLMFLFPAFPDDALCMAAGMTKMRYWYFSIIVLIFRTIGIATICFLGSSIINWAELSIIDWFVLINAVIIDIYAVFKISNKIENKIKNKKSKKEDNQDERNKNELDC